MKKTHEAGCWHAIHPPNKHPALLHFMLLIKSSLIIGLLSNYLLFLAPSLNYPSILYSKNEGNFCLQSAPERTLQGDLIGLVSGTGCEGVGIEDEGRTEFISAVEVDRAHRLVGTHRLEGPVIGVVHRQLVVTAHIGSSTPTIAKQ